MAFRPALAALGGASEEFTGGAARAAMGARSIGRRRAAVVESRWCGNEFPMRESGTNRHALRHTRKARTAWGREVLFRTGLVARLCCGEQRPGYDGEVRTGGTPRRWTLKRNATFS